MSESALLRVSDLGLSRGSIELSLGLAPIVVERLALVLRRVADERGPRQQHVSTALEMADRAYVLQHGSVSVEGPAGDLARQRDVPAISYSGKSGVAPAL